MQQKTFLITGASKGIGRALAQRLALDGHQVIGLARGADPEFPGQLVSVNLTDREATEQALRRLIRDYHFDGVINNFGYIRLERVGLINLDEMERVFRNNLVPAVQTIQALLPLMRNEGWGRVVNLSSLTVLGMPEGTVYAGAKSAMISFTRTWALELACTGITVNAVAPGPVETEMFRKNTPPGSQAEQRFLSQIPMGRFGTPDDIAGTIAFLLSDDANFVTGQTLFVDGGASIGMSIC